MIRIIINGCNGKMGQVVAKMAAADPALSVVAGVDKSPSAQENPFPVFSRITELHHEADVIIDFSRPEALPDLLEYAKKHQTAVVIATTGLSLEDYKDIESYARSIPVFISANMSVGVNLMIDLVQKAASLLGNDYDIEIIEKHHNQKVDAPSGTALALANAINAVFLNSKSYVYGRHSKVEKRTNTEIGIHSIRGGTIVGDHQVLFIGKDEVVEINHLAHSKQIFAVGALRAAQYLYQKPAGLYNMNDVLVEHNTVTHVHTDNQQAMVTINNLSHNPLIIAQLFNEIANERINIDMISQTAPVDHRVDISFTLPISDLNKMAGILEEISHSNVDMKVDINKSVTKLTVEGIGMERQVGVAAKLFNLMAEQDIKVEIITTSETKISYIIDQADEKKALESIIQAFNL